MRGRPQRRSRPPSALLKRVRFKNPFTTLYARSNLATPRGLRRVVQQPHGEVRRPCCEEDHHGAVSFKFRAWLRFGFGVDGRLPWLQTC